jgi:hypothetical protein
MFSSYCPYDKNVVSYVVNDGGAKVRGLRLTSHGISRNRPFTRDQSDAPNKFIFASTPTVSTYSLTSLAVRDPMLH